MIYTIVVICVDSTERSEYMPLLIRSRPEHDYWICVCGFNFACCLDGCLTGLMNVPYCLLMYIQCCTYMYNAYMYIHHSRCNIIDTHIVYI